MKGEEEPRCLHQWSPHQGRPVTSLFFLDNHAHYQPDIQFWKYAVTGCDGNSELKVGFRFFVFNKAASKED
jgi:enhancer of mRNA-decapping protein 4